MSETTLFNAYGEPVAYISDDKTNTVYLWEGEPVAYLESENIYGFNGKHLGWYESGIVWDHYGNRVGFVINTLPCLASLEPSKGTKATAPFKSTKELAPLKPQKSLDISKISLVVLLKSGLN